jgi:catechol 2,3-dioxygenase-like lactoylglutathione lyase family enzyme
VQAQFEVVTLPVSEPDKSLLFYRDQVGFDLDVDYAPAANFRVIQLTPQGAATSIQFGVGLTDAPIGSVRGLYLVVSDIDACRRELTGRGVVVSDIRHKDADGAWRGGFLQALILTGPTMPVSPISVTQTATRGYYRNVVTAEAKRSVVRWAGSYSYGMPPTPLSPMPTPVSETPPALIPVSAMPP